MVFDKYLALRPN